MSRPTGGKAYFYAIGQRLRGNPYAFGWWLMMSSNRLPRWARNAAVKGYGNIPQYERFTP